MPSVRALACPASLKGVLSAREAAAALAEGLRTWAEVDELPVADGGEGTLDVLHSALGGDWREAEVPDAFGLPRIARWLVLADETAVLEAAEAIPLDPRRLDPFAATSRGLGSSSVRSGTARAAYRAWRDGECRRRLRSARGARRASRADSCCMRRRCSASRCCSSLRRAEGRYAVRGARAREAPPRAGRTGAVRGPAGGRRGRRAGCGSRVARRGSSARRAARPRSRRLRPSGYDLVVTGEGTVDRTTASGKAPGEVAPTLRGGGSRCVVFGGRIEALAGVETVALSGDPGRARDDLLRLGMDSRRYLF